ncbi:MAG: squalene synthase HpnC [Burkholderiaceae bacterium]
MRDNRAVTLARSPDTPQKETLSAAPPVTHYENFPVASWLCPPQLRAPITAIYWFARTADDIADEGQATARERLADLQAYRADLLACAGAGPNSTPSSRWPQVFGPLHSAVVQYQLPLSLLADLLSAFAQDVVFSQRGSRYQSQAELRDYCRRSANPVGRLLLHLYGVHDSESLAQSDDICTALQLINFWQDLGLDIARGRFYLPVSDCAAHGVSWIDLLALKNTPQTTQLIATCAIDAKATMLKGSKLVKKLPGRAGWELRLVVQGGLRILDKIEAMNFATLQKRPRIRAWDAPLMLWRGLRM